MKRIILLLLLATSAYGTSVTVPIHFGGGLSSVKVVTFVHDGTSNASAVVDTGKVITFPFDTTMVLNDTANWLVRMGYLYDGETDTLWYDNLYNIKNIIDTLVLNFTAIDAIRDTAQFLVTSSGDTAIGGDTRDVAIAAIRDSLQFLTTSSGDTAIGGDEIEALAQEILDSAQSVGMDNMKEAYDGDEVGSDFWLTKFRVVSDVTDTSAILAIGNGTGEGLNVQSGSGATGDAVLITSNATNGDGIDFNGAGNGYGFNSHGGLTGSGAQFIGGATSGTGAVFTGGATGGIGATFTGTGSSNAVTIAAVGAGRGMDIQSSTGDALYAEATSGNGNGMTVLGNGTGDGASFTSGSGATGSGIQAIAASTNGNGILLTATGTGVEITHDDLVDAVWDEDSTGHYTDPQMAFLASQTGASGGISDADFGLIADSVWLRDTTGVYQVSKMGFEATQTGASAGISDADFGLIADSVWLRDTTGVYQVSKMGFEATQTAAGAGISDADMIAIVDTVWGRNKTDADAVTDGMGDFIYDSLGGALVAITAVRDSAQFLITSSVDTS